MALATMVQPNGTHLASGLVPEAQPDAGPDINWCRRIAQLAEKGRFGLFFIADTPAIRTEQLEIWSHGPVFMTVLEPVTLLSALAGATMHIGLAAEGGMSPAGCTAFVASEAAR